MERSTKRPASPRAPPGLPGNTITVRVENGKTLTADDPYLGVREAEGGYFVLEADDLNTAIELAARVPSARLAGAIEVCPVATYW
jgi:hypothetical protein